MSSEESPQGKSWLQKLSFHESSGSYRLTCWLFLRLLGLTYLIAFASLWSQIGGLIGTNGILPAGALLRAIAQSVGAERFFMFPTLAWINSSDSFLMFLTGGGVCLSLLVVLGICTAPVLILLFMFYLSLVVIGGDFLSFQWDALLLETGFLSIFIAPWKWWEHPCQKSGVGPGPALLFIWLLRLLLFRLTFMSGAVKLLSGDPNWRDLFAVSYHYFTQPLPTPVAWYAAQLPMWFQKLSVAGVFVLELLVPFLIFAPRKLRLISAALICLLQVLIAITGNYCFFNFLTISLCVLLLDDKLLLRCLPAALRGRIELPLQLSKPAAFYKILTVSAAAILFVAGGTRLAADLSGGALEPPVCADFLNIFDSLRIVNSYGVFAIMTTSRLEIVVEGSNDGQHWSEYEFKFKPGDLKRPPPWVAPHQPRLDWQMWFAALGTYRQNRWFVSFMHRLLEGSAPVLALLAHNPFPNGPPTYIRALIYDYRFTDFATRSSSGNWWQRQQKGVYFPAASLEPR